MPNTIRVLSCGPAQLDMRGKIENAIISVFQSSIFYGKKIYGFSILGEKKIGVMHIFKGL